MRAVLHSLGYFFAALNASLTNSAEPTGSMVLSIPSGKTKCVPCSYTTASTSQACGFSAKRFPMRRMYFAVSNAPKEIGAWDSRLQVTSRGYMLGYNDLRDPSVSGFFRFLAKIGDGMMKMQIVKIGFGGGKW